VIFLIEYDRDSGVLVRLDTFDVIERDRASAARLELEIQLFKDGLSREVVLLEADSLDALKKTHGRYFRDVVDLTKPSESRKAGHKNSNP
jgi:hypothetical protein